MRIPDCSRFRSVWLLVVLLAWGCRAQEPPRSESMESKATMRAKVMQISSSAFENGSRIDVKHTVDGQDLSPPLAWSKPPEGTRSLALICDDPDAPSPRKPAANPWVHWVLFNISADVTELAAGIERQPELDNLAGARQGANSWLAGNIGYRGPAPPLGSGVHRYFFRLYALDAMLDLDPGATKQQLLDAMAGHVLAKGQLMGTFER